MLRALPFFIILVFGIFPSYGQIRKTRVLPDYFRAEEPIKNPAKLPAGVLSRVFRDHSNVNESLDRFKKRIAGTYIDLDGNDKLDFIVQGDIGANITGFWLFRNFKGRQRSVLYSRALELRLLRAKHKGMRDIESASATAVSLSYVIYRFNGIRYRRYRCRTEDTGKDADKRPKRFYRCSP